MSRSLIEPRVQFLYNVPVVSAFFGVLLRETKLAQQFACTALESFELVDRNASVDEIWTAIDESLIHSLFIDYHS